MCVPTIKIDSILQKVNAWVKQVGEFQLSHFRSNDFIVTTKSTETDLVTEVDTQSEAYLITQIKKCFPNHCILAEEGGNIDLSSDYRWIIDPLDGTTNFVSGLPFFCISIALQYKNETVLGVVYVPYLQELFYATKGGGAFLNGKKLQVAETTILEHAVVCTGFPSDKSTYSVKDLSNANRVLSKVRGFRQLGAAAYDLSLIAAGILDGFWQSYLHLWDIAAGCLLIEEAGGRVQLQQTGNEYSITCGNNHIVQLLQDMFNDKDTKRQS